VAAALSNEDDCKQPPACCVAKRVDGGEPDGVGDSKSSEAGGSGAAIGAGVMKEA
jgi:hypothetical protein